MLITDELIESLNPCKRRHANYLKHYGNGKGRSLKAFLRLSKITYSDKVWVAMRVLPSIVLQRWAALCAESVLHVYEDAYPNDDRPRRAVEAALAGTATQEIIDAAYAAAEAAYAVYAAARAAWDAADAWNAAHADYAAARAAWAAADAWNAAHADYAAARAAWAAARAAGTAGTADAAPNRKAQKKLNLELLLKAYKELT